jgi:Holliday junction resolvasome RuvABC endonuclease subunit
MRSTAHTVLALDLGLHCGYAIYDTIHPPHSGVLRLRASRRDNYGAALCAFASFLRYHPTHVIAYERVRRHQGTRAAHVYGALEGVLAMHAWTHGHIRIMPVEVAHIKRHATGRGNATKQMMLATARDRWPSCATHDEADALWILDLARHRLAAQTT